MNKRNETKLQVRFLSRNKHKIDESRRILQAFDIELLAVNAEIEELQTLDTQRLVRDKALKAFKQVGRPLFVEHTGLYLDLLKGFPGGLTQIFWDTLQKEIFSDQFASEKSVTAKTEICYVDGRQIWHFEGEINGKIVNPPRIDNGFQWDCIFIPDGFDQTFSEMGDKKDKVSMRRKALEKLAKHISES